MQAQSGDDNGPATKDGNTDNNANGDSNSDNSGKADSDNTAVPAVIMMTMRAAATLTWIAAAIREILASNAGLVVWLSFHLAWPV
jgi:hypothetical protein